MNCQICSRHDDVIKWKHCPRYWHIVTGEFPHKGQWRGALKFSMICAWRNGWVNNRYIGYLKRRRAHYDITVMVLEPRSSYDPMTLTSEPRSWKFSSVRSCSDMYMLEMWLWYSFSFMSYTSEERLLIGFQHYIGPTSKLWGRLKW